MEEEIKEKQVVPESLENAETLEKKRKREVIFELALFFILGFLIGITVKTEAVKRITIGFSDYKMAEGKSSYDIESMKKSLEQQAKAQQDIQQAQQEQADSQPESDQAQQ